MKLQRVRLVALAITLLVIAAIAARELATSAGHSRRVAFDLAPSFCPRMDNPDWADRIAAQMRAQDALLAAEHARQPADQMRIVKTSLLFWADGMAVVPGLVVLNPEAPDDPGLLAHEAVHSRQMRDIGLLLFWWRYLTSRDFRLWAEAEAYRVSLRYEPGDLRHFARALAHGYCLGITPKHAESLLRT